MLSFCFNLVIIALISFSSLLITVVCREPIDCKTTRLINPCHCINDITNESTIKEIICSDIFIETLDLKLISYRLQAELNSGDKSQIFIEKLIVRNTSLKYIRSEVFSKIGFQSIEIIGNYDLETIDKNAFDGSVHSAQEIKFVNNQNLHNFNSYERDIWDF